MSGTIYLGGSWSHLDEAALWRVMFAGRPRVVYWPFALPRRRARRSGRSLTRALRDLGLAADLDLWTRLEAHVPGELESADLLVVGGGNTFDLLATVQRCGFLEPVRAWVAGGGNYYGGSAGAILASTDIAIAGLLDPNDARLRDLTGLGLVSQAVLPHFDPHAVADARAWSGEHTQRVLGLPDRSGLVVRGGEAEAVGPDPVWVIDDTAATSYRPGERWDLSGPLDRAH